MTLEESPDERLRRLLAADPDGAIDEALAGLGRKGIAGPLLDEASLCILLNEPTLTLAQLSRVVRDGVCVLRYARSEAAGAVARHPAVTDELALAAFCAGTNLRPGTSPMSVPGDATFQLFAAARHPVAAAWMLAAIECRAGRLPFVCDDDARRDLTEKVACWLGRLQLLPAPAAAAAVVVDLGDTWPGEVEDLFTLAAAVAT